MDVGFTIYGIPLRLGELIFLLFLFRMIYIDPILKIRKINKIGFLILLLLFINLLLVVSVTFFSKVDNSFYTKYILRNVLYLLAMITFILKPIKYDKIKVDFFIKYILYVVVVFYIMEYINFYLVDFGWNSIFVSRQGKNVFNNFLIRFAGPSSEPAYIIPLLSIPLMYGLLKRKLSYSLVSILLMLLTFSSFGYMIIILSGFYLFKNIENREVKIKAKKLLSKGIVFIIFIGLIFANKVSTLIQYNWTKFEAYFGVGNVKEWSATQRIGHIKLAIELFMKSSWFRMLVGNGTGYYSKESKEFVKYYLDAGEEAHNLYISTLVDRGLIGLLLVILLFYIISKIKIPKDIYGNYKYFFIAIKYGVLVRMIHWFFTGMLWQYYFWVEVALLISASSYYIKVSNDKK